MANAGIALPGNWYCCSRPSRNRAEIVTYLRMAADSDPLLQALPDLPNLTHAFAKAGRHPP